MTPEPTELTKMIEAKIRETAAQRHLAPRPAIFGGHPVPSAYDRQAAEDAEEISALAAWRKLHPHDQVHRAQIVAGLLAAVVLICSLGGLVIWEWLLVTP